MDQAWFFTIPFLSTPHALHPFTAVSLLPSISSHPPSWASCTPSHSSCTLTTPCFADKCTIIVTLATSQLHSLSKDRQCSTASLSCSIPPFPLTPKLHWSKNPGTEEEEGWEQGFLCSQHKHLLSQLPVPALLIWANSWMKLIRLHPSLRYAKWEAILPSLAHVPGSLADRAGGRHREMPGDAPSWVTHHSTSSRAALLPGVWQQDVQLARHSGCYCANTCLNNDIFKLTPTEMFAFCSHTPQECFLLIDLTAWDFPKIIIGFMTLLPGGVLLPFKQILLQRNESLVLLKISGFLASTNPAAGFPALMLWHPFLAPISWQWNEIHLQKNLLQTLSSSAEWSFQFLLLLLA